MITLHAMQGLLRRPSAVRGRGHGRRPAEPWVDPCIAKKVAMSTKDTPSTPSSPARPTGPREANGVMTGDVLDETERRIRILNGPLRGATYLIRERVGIGRASSSDIQLVHDGISRQHAQIVTDDRGRHVLVDLDSSNGTF